MATRARVTVHGNVATLTEAGRTLTVRVLAPSGAGFTVAPADPPDDGFNAPNPGVSLLRLDVVHAGPSTLTLAVQGTPETTNPADVDLAPLAAW
jgi:hypothetical protein